MYGLCYTAFPGGASVLSGLENYILDLITRLYDSIGWPGVVLLMAIESANIPVPSEIIMPLSGWLLVQAKGLGLSHLLLAGFYGALGNVLGSIVSYWIGAVGGRPFLERYGKYLLITRSDLEKADRWFHRRGDLTVFVSRLLPVVRTFISFPAGVAHMNFPKFVLFTFLGAFPWSLGLAYGGYVLGQNWEDLRSVMRPFDIPILLLIAALVGWYVWRHLKHLREDANDRPSH